MAAISFVSTATPWSADTSGTGFTINKPSGLQQGDFMIALLAFTPGYNNAQRTVSVPSGWTKQADAFKNGNDDFPSQICVMVRQASASEPSSWSGSLSASGTVRMVGCVAYRSVLGVFDDGTSGKAGGSSYSTASVSNTKSGTWRVTLASYLSGSLNYNLNTNEVTSRLLGGDANTSTDDSVQIRMADSDGVISSGSTSRTVSRSAVWSASTSWIGLLELLEGTPAAGPFGVTLHGLSGSAAGSVHDDATLSVSLGGVSVSASGVGAPIAGSGGFASSLGGVGVSVSGGTDVSGSVSMLLPIDVSLVAETRFFGVRVIEVPLDRSRRIIIRSRAVDD